MKIRSDRDPDRIRQLGETLDRADAVLIGAGAGLSTSAGYAYGGERFRTYFSDFAEEYDIRDMYSGGFYPFETPEEYWAWWSRCIYYNRYVMPPKPVYEELLEIVKEKDYFVLTTNADHVFQRVGFAKERLFYTQGDYGLWQCAAPCHKETYDNEETVCRMMEAQGFLRDASGIFAPPADAEVRMMIPGELVPRCPKCGRPMTMNLRCDDTFTEDEGWHAAAARYAGFLEAHDGQRVLFLELGVGSNTPVIIKYPFRQMTARNPEATYACINFGEADCPRRIAGRSICINDDIGRVLTALRTGRSDGLS